ncbi:helix-turn-helix transcriptional regulator [Flavobacterium sp. RHBU_3]|uniref:helix-turn-helix transcriptional regulator n=1 Tax=Flavobacterium sp. RHBU_3 TaxID=3391184 RepID=UPI003984B886
MRPPIPGIIPGDYNIEFIGIIETKTVITLQNGQPIPFKNIPGLLKSKLYKKMQADDKAMESLGRMPMSEALEHFVFCLYGDVDNTPDVHANGKLGETENFRCGEDCICLGWKSKDITINGTALTPRQIQVADKLASDMPDKQIAAELGMTVNTLITHKQNVYEKAGVMSRSGFVQQAFQNRVVR